MRLIVLALLLAPCAAHAQGGPPFLTNDPGTPGDGHWEINVAAAQTLERGIDSYQLPQFDFNYGVGERVQLTYEVPYVIDTTPGSPITADGATLTPASNGDSSIKARTAGSCRRFHSSRRVRQCSPSNEGLHLPDRAFYCHSKWRGK